MVRLGSGTFGDVYKILFEGELAAMKVFKSEAEYHKEVSS